jgi:hypothetical protein
MIDNTARIDRIVQGSGLVHMLRLQILDAFGRDPGDMSPPELDCWYVLFVAEVDGHYTDLLDRMCALDADFVREMISCSTAGDPAWIAPTEPARLPPFFRRFMWRCLIKTRVPYFAYQSSLAEVRRALQLQHEFTRCAIQWQYHNGPRPQDWTDFCDDNRQLLW